jgi:hypothetical protein
MYHYMQMDPSLIKERHEQMRAEMSKRRLVKQLRKHHEWSGPRLLASFASRVRSVRFAGRVCRTVARRDVGER